MKVTDATSVRGFFSSFHEHLPFGIDTVFFTALAKSPEERFTTCTQFIETLAQIGDYEAAFNTPDHFFRLSSILWGDLIYRTHRWSVGKNSEKEANIPRFPMTRWMDFKDVLPWPFYREKDKH